MKRLRVHIARLIVWLTEPICPYCRQHPDDCRCDPWWRYADV